MIVRLALVTLAAANLCQGAIRAQQILQVPGGQQQTVTYVTTDKQGNLIVTGNDGGRGFIKKLDRSGNLVFTYSLDAFPAFPSSIAVDGKGDIYWVGSGNRLAFPPSLTKVALQPPDPSSVAGF